MLFWRGFKGKNNDLTMSRQSRQIGAEIIGIKKNTILTEIIFLIVRTLEKLNFKDFILNFSMPNLIKAITEDFQLSKGDCTKLIKSYKNKNLDFIKSFPNEIIEISSFFLSSIGSVDKNLQNLKKYKFKKKIKKK